MIFCYRQTDRHTLHHNIYIITINTQSSWSPSLPQLCPDRGIRWNTLSKPKKWQEQCNFKKRSVWNQNNFCVKCFKTTWFASNLLQMIWFASNLLVVSWRACDLTICIQRLNQLLDSYPPSSCCNPFDIKCIKYILLISNIYQMYIKYTKPNAAILLISIQQNMITNINMPQL